MRTSPPVSPAVSDAVPSHFDLLKESHRSNVFFFTSSAFFAEAPTAEGLAQPRFQTRPQDSSQLPRCPGQAAKGLCKGRSAETKLLFACAGPGSVTEDAAWYRGVRRNLEDASVFRKAVEGEQCLDKKDPSPFFIGHLRYTVRVCVLTLLRPPSEALTN